MAQVKGAATGRCTGRRQRGDALLLILLTLLVLGLGLMLAMRRGLTDARLAGNHLAKHKATQVSDLALYQLETTLQAFGSIHPEPLEFSATGEPWYRDVPAGTAPPDAAYWKSCLKQTAPAGRCLSLPVGASAPGFSALAVVQPTNRRDTTTCEGAGHQLAVYYALHLHVLEAGGTSSDIETVYKLCMLQP